MANGRPDLGASLGTSQKTAPIGVLGVIFKWDSLAQTIVEATPIEAADRERTVVAILDERGQPLAIPPPHALLILDDPSVLEPNKNSLETKVGGRPALVAHTRSPGYETYRTGWHSVIVTLSG